MGLHARPASLFVQEANKFSSDITVILGDAQGDAKSILDLLLLGASQGATITVRAEGPDAEVHCRHCKACMRATLKRRSKTKAVGDHRDQAMQNRRAPSAADCASWCGIPCFS